MGFLKRPLVLVVIFFMPVTAYSQTYSISGKVLDKETKEGLPGAEVYIHELVTGTISGEDGSFVIRGLKPATYHIHITFVGFESVFEYIEVNKNLENLIYYLQPSSLELMEIVIESDPFKTGPVEKSLATSTVRNDFIRKNPAGTLISSLQEIPGINAINTGIGISKPVIRGLSFNRVIVADKGIKQEGQQWGADHGLEIDQYDPEQIEIVKGPASLIYGSDGLGGIIVINPPYLAQENTYNGEILGVYKGNNNLLGTSLMLRGNKKGVVFRFRYSYQGFADYRVPADKFTYNGYILPIYENRLKNTAGSENNLNFSLGLKKKWGYSTVTLSNFHQVAGLFPGATGIPREYLLEPDGTWRNTDLPRQVINHFKLISNSNVIIGSDWLEVNLGYQYNDRNEEGAPHAHGYQPTPDGYLALGLDLQTWSANVRYNLARSERIKRIFGLQYQYQENTSSGFEFLLPVFYNSSIGGFIQEQRSFGNTLTLNAGIRGDYGNTRILEHHEPDYTTLEDTDTVLRNPAIRKEFLDVSGGLGLSYYPSHHLNIKFNLGKSFRMPAPAELSMNGVHHGTFRHEIGNPDLTSESGWQADLSILYHQEHFLIQISPFFNYFRDYIYLRPTVEFSNLPAGGQVFRYEQHDAIFTGFEFNSDYHIWENLHLETGWEYIWNYNLMTNLPLPFTPPLSVTFKPEWEIPVKSRRFREFFVSAGFRYTTAQYRVDRNENVTENYFLVNAGTGFTVPVGNLPMEFNLSIQNIFNQYYMNHLSRYRWINLPEQGRNFNLLVRIPVKIAN